MKAAEFQQQLEETVRKNAGRVAPLPVEANEDTIAPHIKRVHDYALANPCVLDEDFYRVFAEGRNRAIFTYSNGWLVSILVSVAADETFEKLFWQVSTSLVSAFNAKPKAVRLLTRNERAQLTRSRDIVLKDVSELAADDEANIIRFHQEKAFHACCDLSLDETTIAVANMNEEQQGKLKRL